MQFIRGVAGVAERLELGCVLTLGNFDGFHLGHQYLANSLKELARRYHLPSVVITFTPHPQEFFGSARRSISSLREKLYWLAESGIDLVVLLPFNLRLAKLSAQQFIETILVNKLRIKHLLVGNDFVLGHGREGNSLLLQKLANNYNFTLTYLAPLKVDDIRVSSSLIRAKLLASRDATAIFPWLGRPHMIIGRVIQGARRGHLLGYPTANLYLHDRELLYSGVYLVKVGGLGAEYYGVANVGSCPTFQKKGKKSLEVHILYYDGSLYGKILRLEFLKKFREEQTFSSALALQQQIAQDLQLAKEAISL